MRYDEIEKNICADDLSSKYEYMANTIGLINFILLIEEYGGTSVYLPTKKELYKPYIYKKILAEYDGENKSLLSKKYNVSANTIYRLIRNEITIE